MMKLVLMICVLGATAFQNLAEAQVRRGNGRAGRHEQPRRQVYPSNPPVVVVPPQHYPQPQYYPSSLSLINEAASGMIRGCEVRLRVDGWANQLYVNGQFSGNFRTGVQDYQLADAIDSYLYRGVCRRLSAYESQLMNSPYLIQDFARGLSRNCYVRLNVAGWANQLYVNGVFSGNFDSRTDEMRLRMRIAELVMNGTCIY